MMFGLSRRQDQGFSLVEVLVSITIMALIAAVGVSNFRGFQRRKSTDAVANQIRSDLAVAKEYAIAGRKNCSDANFVFDGYRVIQDDATHYSIYSLCNGSTDVVAVKTFVKIPSSSNHTISFNPASFDFLALAKGATDNVDITITNTSTGDVQTLRVTKAGEIY